MRGERGGRGRKVMGDNSRGLREERGRERQKSRQVRGAAHFFINTEKLKTST